MAKHRYGWDEAKILRFHREQRGLGHGSDYKPWITIQDVSSLGRSTRAHSFKTGREHHLLSDIETAVFFLFDWSDAVLDIREQFPLDRDVTRKIAAEMGVRHPADPKSRVDIVMTTDFMIDALVRGEPMECARAVKPFGDLGDRRTLEKLEIERRYWQLLGVDWRLVTDRDYSKVHIKNLRWLHEMRSLEHLDAPHADYWGDRCNRVLVALRASRGMTISAVLKQLEETQGFAPGEGLTALRNLLATKAIGMNLDEAFRASAPVSALNLAGETIHRMVA